MAIQFINPGPSKYPEDGGMAPASVKRGENLLNTVLGAGNAARAIDVTTEGIVTVFLNGEEIKADSTNGDIRKFFRKGEGQGPGGKRFGTIRTLEIVGSGKFKLIVD